MATATKPKATETTAPAALPTNFKVTGDGSRTDFPTRGRSSEPNPFDEVMAAANGNRAATYRVQNVEEDQSTRVINMLRAAAEKLEISVRTAFKDGSVHFYAIDRIKRPRKNKDESAPATA
jgi:hypothetical protein